MQHEAPAAPLVKGCLFLPTGKGPQRKKETTPMEGRNHQLWGKAARGQPALLRLSKRCDAIARALPESEPWLEGVHTHRRSMLHGSRFQTNILKIMVWDWEEGPHGASASCGRLIRQNALGARVGRRPMPRPKAGLAVLANSLL